MTTRTAYVRLLQIQPSLGAQLTREELVEARRLAVVPAVTLPAGSWEAGELARMCVPGQNLGCIIADGIIAHELVLGGRTATHLLGRGDLIFPAVRPSGHLPLSRVFGVADASRLAVLDSGFAAVARRWPSIAEALLSQAERQMERVAVQQLISQLRRADQRIMALLWHLADRWGRREGDGVVVPLTLDHQAIGQLVGGRRPTISAALGRLADQELVVRLANGTWWLATASLVLLDDERIPAPTMRVRLLGVRTERMSAARRSPDGSGISRT
jgi:CRP/FNR family transcriptional regulator, cyclic AMP receptor protein